MNATPWEMNPGHPRCYVLYQVDVEGRATSTAEVRAVFSVKDMAERYASRLYHVELEWKVFDDWRWFAELPNTELCAMIARLPLNPRPEEIE